MRVKGTIPVGINILKKPMSLKALKTRAEGGRISVNIILGLGEIMTDINSLNDIADKRVLDLDSVVGSLSDINYSVVGHLPVMNNDGTTNYDGFCQRGAVILNVDADVSDLLKEEE
jgi:hypothetical protein